MNSAHKPGSDSGIDRGLVAVVLLWIAITIALAILLAVRALGMGSHPLPTRATNPKILQEEVNRFVLRRRPECQLRL